MAGGGQAAFAAAVLKGIGAPVTSENIAGFIGWSKAEGGDNWARNNPLNTTQGGPGAVRTINSAGVKAYANPQAGVRATIQTLRNGAYGGIIRAFRSNNPRGLGAAIGASPWGTSGSLASQTIAQTLGQHFNVGASSLGAAASPNSVGAGGSTAATTRNMFNAGAYQQASQRAIAGQYLAGQSESSDPYAAGQPKTGLSTAASSNPLLSSGELTTKTPNPQAYVKAQTTLQHLAGNAQLSNHPTLQMGLANKALNDAQNAGASRDAVKLLGMIKSVIGGQYNQGNHNAVSEGRGQIRSQGTDCSGLISWLMGPNGLGIWHTSLATPGIPSAPGLQSGRGSVITLWNNRQPGNAGHVFIQIGNQFFASEGGVGIHQLSHGEVQNYLQHGSDGGTYQAFHPRGL